MFLALLVKNIPFWSVPIMIISLQTALTARSQEKKEIFKYCVYLIIFCVLSLTYFIYMGSAQNAIAPFVELGFV